MLRASLVLLTLWPLAALAGCPAPPEPPRFELDQTDEGIEVRLGGELIARYLVGSGSKPVLWPVLGPGGREMTRGYPLREAAGGEATDHPHHRSLWLGHGRVNGIDFWLDEGTHGRIVHRDFEELSGGEQATIVATSEWITPQDEVLCRERRKMVFGTGENARWIDFDIQLTAVNEPVVFGDTKEGTFALRAASWLKVEGTPGGTIVNSRGQTNEDAWGQVAEWVDYYAPVEGGTAGIAIFNHPQSFRFPTHWHVRTYGLFAANPFGLHAFDSHQTESGAYELAAGESLRLRYRVLLHEGSPQEAGLTQVWQAYSAEE